MPLMRSSSKAINADRGFKKVKVVLGKSKGSSLTSSGGVMTLESKSCNADRAHGKVKVDTGKSKGSSDGVRTIREDDKAHRRVKDFVGRSNGSSDSGRTLKTRPKWKRKEQSRGNGNDGALNYGNSVENSRKFRSWEKRDLKTKSGEKGFDAASDGNSGRKKKRIYTVHGKVEDGLYDVRKLDRKAKFRVKKNVVDSYFDNGKDRPRGRPRDLQDSGKYKSLSGSKIFKENELLDKRSVRGKTEGTDKVKHVQESVLVNGTLKTVRRKYPVDSAVKSHRNRFQSKKSLRADAEFLGSPPKKSKRVIRLDRHDISNKRLDDTIANNGNSQGDKDLEPSEGEISKNAQFRAIIPSSSILSFVEDNLLGRRREIEFRRAGYNIELPSPLDNLPMSTTSERERIEVPVFRNKLEFFAAANISSSFPDPDLPEIAFAGRSNVGKSSLLNSLTRQWGVVRTSDKPGLTQSINFFKLGPKLSLVDLPGYGFAYAKDEVKEAWEELVKEYVSTRVGLQRVCLLVDTKWGLKPRDHELIDLMERSQTKYQIVLTKTDMVFPVDVARRARQIEENLTAKKSAVQPLMMVSSKTGAGIRSLRTALANIVRRNQTITNRRIAEDCVKWESKEWEVEGK